ncbi:MAG: LLM class flavin-dependent oxidoreductase [Hyphomicrobiaceae bacterium]
MINGEKRATPSKLRQYCACQSADLGSSATQIPPSEEPATHEIPARDQHGAHCARHRHADGRPSHARDGADGGPGRLSYRLGGRASRARDDDRARPVQICAWWAAHTERIRIGVAVAVAAYWHPIKLAGAAALFDLVSGGRSEFGIGSGAYQREFDRMMPGLKQTEGWRYMQEMLPLVQALWQGDVEHKGEFWSFSARHLGAEAGAAAASADLDRGARADHL